MGRNTKLSCMQEAAFGGNGTLTVSLISTGKEGKIYITICMLKFTVLHQVIDLFNHNFKDSVGIQKMFFQYTTGHTYSGLFAFLRRIRY